MIHTNTGGATVDTIYEQTPQLFYLRGYVAPQIISLGEWSGSLEIGGGGTALGPMATLGASAEWRPAAALSVDGGIAAWMQWSQFRTSTYMSGNLNAHLGVAYWF